MKIIFLDAYTTNPGDLSFSILEDLGEFTAFEHSTKKEALERGSDADVIITNKHQICSERLAHWPNCKLIAIAATGYNNVDLKACKKRGIKVSNVKGYSTHSVAQLTFASILNIINKVSYYNHEVKSGRWSSSRDFSFYDHSIRDLSKLRIGIFGLGNIGLEIAEIAKAFHMDIIAVSKYPDKAPDFIKIVEQNELFETSDVISLNVPLNRTTEYLINKASLSIMKKNAILVNTARGPLINEEDLAIHLRTNSDFSAVLDVLSEEPPTPDLSLLELSNCHITPHIAWASLDARRSLIEGIASNIRNFKAGTPSNLVG